MCILFRYISQEERHDPLQRLLRRLRRHADQKRGSEEKGDQRQNEDRKVERRETAIRDEKKTYQKNNFFKPRGKV